VLETTIERSQKAGLTVALVSACRDVDTPADLEALAATRSGMGKRTEEFIARHLPGSAVSRQEVPPSEQPRPQEGKPT
jgi:2-phospho-L-lactate guanylyltransferase (CobY/MobA/RfbA family)